jgi:endonuclease YncB( thermonuclease family)
MKTNLVPLLFMLLIAVGCENSTHVEQPTDQPQNSLRPNHEGGTQEFGDGAEVISAKVLRVIDGDTIEFVSTKYGTRKLRLSDIDAPEKDQPYGAEATAYLTRAILRQTIIVRIDGKDSYNRLLGTIKGTGLKSLNLGLVEIGYAWHYKKYSTDDRFSRAELKAKALRSGLWSSAGAVAPWDWRNTSKQPTPSGNPKTLNLIDLDGAATIIAADGKYLGLVSSNKYNPKSIINEYGAHGSKHRTDSINNQYGTYGSKYQSKSAFNNSASSPPKVYIGNKFIGYLTTNKSKTPRIDPHRLVQVLKSKK